MNTQIPLSGQIKFSKLHSAGNDFICIDNTNDQLDDVLSSPRAHLFVKGLTARGIGIGGDGLLVAYRQPDGSDAHIQARFLEPDGSEARLCGNGTACFTYWALREELVTEHDVFIHTKAGTAHARIAQDKPNAVTVCVPDPKDINTDLALITENRRWTVNYINSGVPHAVVFCDDLENLDVLRWGKVIRNHEKFAPEGVNVDFVKVRNTGEIEMRTYEFGVENETLACGTGAVAAAILGSMRHDWPVEYRRGQKAVQVHVKSGESLFVRFVTEDFSSIRDVCLDTNVTLVYEGLIEESFIEHILTA